MTQFRVNTSSTATVDADPAAVWAALTDPKLLPRLTPYLKSIEVDGDRWRWNLTRIPVLSAAVSPSFTELMTFDEPTSITFTHDPAHTDEQAGVEGQYHLKEAPASGTELSIELAISLDLPLPRIARPAVRTAMRGLVSTMGIRFSSNLVRHLQRSR